jgi:epoxyqueuosine reductase
LRCVSIMKSWLREESRALGFVAVGWTRPERPFFFDAYRDWVSSGKQADMHWMGRRMDVREDPTCLLDGCRSIISLAYPYSALKPASPEGYEAARYTEPACEDYHRRVRRLCSGLVDAIRSRYPDAGTRICVDTAPVLERSLAFASGVGFIGKNTTLIVPGHGSFVFLAEILTTVPLPGSGPVPLEGLCGVCSRCVDACPTGALETPYCLDASKCLSYLTIEYGGPLDAEWGRKMGRCFLGCDVCQEVCPFNQGPWGEVTCLPSAGEMLRMEEGRFREQYGHTAFSRAGLERIKRNLKAMGIEGLETVTRE